MERLSLAEGPGNGGEGCANSDSEDHLNQLREWAVDTMIHFYNAIAKPATKALKKYSQRACIFGFGDKLILARFNRN
jgi:hypothetical protein